MAILRFFIVVNKDAVQDTSKPAIAKEHFCAATNNGPLVVI